MKKFIKKIEDFRCENCGHQVKGNGYTNHCPKCLWSKHVDINPGDRQNECGGVMEPEEAFFQNGNWFVMHKCQKCGDQKKIKLKENDNLKAVEEDNFKKNSLIYLS